MIYSNEFVWLHFPKCAGTKIERLFSKYFSNENGINQDIVNIKINPFVTWHDTVAQREKRDAEFKLGKRIVIFPIRRLPSWLESRYNYERSRTPNLPDIPEILLKGKFLNQEGSIIDANEVIKNFLPEYLIKSNQIKFIRTEYFEEDFKKVFGKYVDVSKIPNTEFSEKANSSKNCIPDEIKQQIYNSENRLYEFCPYWKMVEEMAYGDLSIPCSINHKIQKTKDNTSIDKHVDVFRDTAIKAIQKEDWVCALKNLQVAHFIKPNAPFIRLQLINTLVQLKKFEEVIPHLDFLNNPPDCIIKNSSLNKIRNKLCYKQFI